MRAECKAEGGNLASIHSEEENSLIYNLLRPARPGYDGEQYTWLGASYIDRGTYVWEDFSRWDYEHWDSSGGEAGSNIGNCGLSARSRWR